MNRCGPEAVVMAPGDAWVFNNHIRHSVENNGDTDRVNLIISMRCE